MIVDEGTILESGNHDELIKKRVFITIYTKPSTSS